MKDSFISYIQDRFGKIQLDPSEVREARQAYIDSRLSEVKEIIGIKGDAVKLLTIRQTDCDDSLYLRQVYAYPDSQVKNLEDWSRERAYQCSNADNAVNGIEKSNLVEDVVGDDNESNCYFFTALHRLGTIDIDSSKSYPHSESFVRRIEKLYRDLNGNSDCTSHTCLFSVQLHELNDKNNKTYKISRIFAVYFDAHGCIWTDSEKLKQLHFTLKKIFGELDTIRELEANLFKSQGMTLAIELNDIFLNYDFAPADKISFMIERLKLFLNNHVKQHFIGAEYDKSAVDIYYVAITYEQNKADKNCLMPLFQIYPHCYRKSYPIASYKIAHQSFPSIAKYLLRHYFQANIGKTDGCEFAMGKYAFDSFYNDLNQSSISIDDNFTEVTFKDIDASHDRVEVAHKIFSNYNDQLFARRPIKSENNASASDANVFQSSRVGQVDEKFWDGLNLDVKYKPNDTQNEQADSIMAFVIEGQKLGKRRTNRKIYRQLPRAILAVESKYYDAFTHSEREALREIITSIAILVRNIFHENSLLNYRSKLSDAYKVYVPAEYSTTKVSLEGIIARFLLASMAIDAEIAEDILDSLNSDGGAQGKITKKIFKRKHIELFRSYFKNVLGSTKIVDDEVKSSKIVNDRIFSRLYNATTYVNLSKVRRKYTSLKEEDLASFVTFIEAMPNNFAWAGYAPSIAEAFGDRSEETTPFFELMTPGFSGSHLYMAIVKGEIQQVAKLSSLRDLRKELKKYRQFVRYRLLSAARTPLNGMSFDSTGELGKDMESMASRLVPEDYDQKSYGVLISDLVSAFSGTDSKDQGNQSQIVESLLQHVHYVIVNSSGTLVKIDVNEICRALKDLFIKSLALWRGVDDVPQQIIDLSPAKVIIDTLRLQPSESAEAHYKKLINGDKKSKISYLKSKLLLECVTAKRLASLYTEGPAIRNRDRAQYQKYIVHGDLNARNIVWAAAIDHYVLIDFEHTNYGVWGSDQFRLVVNLLVELPSELMSGTALSDVRDNVFVEIDLGVNWLLEIANWLLEGIGALPFEGGDRDGMIVKIFKAVLCTIVIDPEKELSMEQKQIWKHMLVFTILKELEYSVLSVKTILKRHESNSDFIKEINSIIKKNIINEANLILALRHLYCESSNISASSADDSAGAALQANKIISVEKAAIARYMIALSLFLGIEKALLKV